MKKLAKFTSIICLLIGLAWLLATVIRDRRNPTARRETRPPTAIVGIWKNAHGTIIDLRADGTLRWRSADGPTNSIQYCRYRLSGDRFSIVYPAEPDDYLRRMKQAVHWQPDDNYVLMQLTNAELHLLDPALGDTDVFGRIEDSAFDTAP